jgi:Asp-tRNA(Asn)/Glu-tRNA(Gln) amidotransferase A subunit family amidase
VIPLSPSLDTIGILVSDVAGAILASSALLDGWGKRTVDRHPSVGVPLGTYLGLANPEAAGAFQRARARLQAAGWTIRPIELLADFEAVRRRHETILTAEAERVHRIWFQRYADLYHPKTAELIRRGMTIPDEELAAALAERDVWTRNLTGVMDGEGIDVWISPSTTSAAPHGLDSTGDPVMNLPWTQAGLPTITVPCGRASSGLPLGLQVAGRQGEDEQLLEFAKAIEALMVGQEQRT